MTRFNSPNRLLVRPLACLILSACVVWGQDPFAPAPAAAPPKVGGKKAAVPAGPPASPAAAAILATNPTDVAGLIGAINTLDRLQEIELAKPLMQQLVALNPDDAKLADAVEKLGSPVFFGLAKIEALQPQAKALADRALLAAGKRARDPARLKQQAQTLAAAETESTQGPALAALLTGGDAAAAILIGELRDDKLTPAGRARLLGVLREIGAVDPLLATLRSDSPLQRMAAIELLPELGGAAAIVGLYAPALAGDDTPADPERTAARNGLTNSLSRLPTRTEAAAQLNREASAWLNDDRRLPVDAAGNSVVWSWDPKQQLPVAATVDRRAAQTLRAVQWTDDAIVLAPDDVLTRRLWLTAHLRAAAWAQGFDVAAKFSPAEVKQVAAWGPIVVEDALAAALKSGDQAAAAGAARMLAQTGLATGLKGPKPHPLVDAVRSIEPRVRFAALETLIGMDIKENFLGSGYLQDAVSQFAALRGTAQGVVGFRSEPVSTQLAGFLSIAGLEGVPVTTGRGMIRAAQQTPDAELLIVSAWIDHDPLTLTIQELRRDLRTAALPIVILCEEAGELPKLAAFYDGMPNITTVIRPYDTEATKFVIEQLRRVRGSFAVTAEIRRAQGVFALTALGKLLDANPKLYDFRSQTPMLIAALDDAWRIGPAADALARIGDHAAQLGLVEYASRPEAPLPQRTVAVTAFADSVRRRGLRLTKADIAGQYALYNAAERAPAETQKILAAILDAIEAPTKTQAVEVKAAR